VDVDRGQFVYPSLKDVAVIVNLHELALVGGRAAGGRHRRRFERFAQVGEELPDRPRLRDERDQTDVAATVRALERKLLPHPGQEFRPGNPGGVVRPGLRLSVAAAFRGLPAGRGIAPLADVPDRQRRDGPPQLVIRRRHLVIAMPVPPRRRNEIGEPVEELNRRELDDAVGSWPRGLPPATRRRKPSGRRGDGEARRNTWCRAPDSSGGS
jgi:hypothetical protein